MQSVLVVQGKVFVQNPLILKSSKAKSQFAQKNNNKKIHMQTAQTTLHEINFKMQLAQNNFTKQTL